nr:MAG: hypothetical protein [Microvirus sp.]
MKFQTAFTEKRKRGEKNTKPSLTIPDESYSIKEILYRSQQGLMPSVTKRTYFNQIENFEEIGLINQQGLDLTDIDVLTEKLNEKKLEREENERKKIGELLAEQKAKEKEALRLEILSEQK